MGDLDMSNIQKKLNKSKIFKYFGEKQMDRVISNSCTYPSHRLKVFQDRRIKNIYNTSSLHKKILCNKILFVKNDNLPPLPQKKCGLSHYILFSYKKTTCLL